MRFQERSRLDDPPKQRKIPLDQEDAQEFPLLSVSTGKPDMNVISQAKETGTCENGLSYYKANVKEVLDEKFV